MTLKALSDIYLHKTRLAYLWTRILNTPFWALYTLLPFIISKDLNATPFQIACIISLNPIASLFSLYWSSQIKSRRDRLVSNIIWASILGHLPFLFVPFVNNPWFFVFASAIYMLFYRGVNPAWMEVLKVNLSENKHKSVFAYASAIYHSSGAVLAIVVGWLLDDYVQAWRWLFPLTALCSFGAIAFQAKMPVKESMEKEVMDSTLFSWKERFQRPWKETRQLMRERPDFARFQIGFMLGGGGLMLWQPALPQFFFEILHLNFKELALAMTFCKTAGYMLALPLWTRAMSRIDLFVFSGNVTAIAALFPLGLIAAQWNLLWLYGAYFLYGMMQAGSELSWNLSGPIFAKKEDSSTYSGVNVVTIGMRGCIAPPLGSLLCSLTNASMVLLMGGGFCLLATWQMYSNRQKEEKPYLLSPP